MFHRALDLISGFCVRRFCRLDPSAKDAEGDDDDDAVPDLVENFEEVSQVRFQLQARRESSKIGL